MTPEESLKQLKETADDFESVRIPIVHGIKLSRETGHLPQNITGPAILIREVSGRERVVDAATAELLLNDGLLHRLGIPIRLWVHGGP